MEEKKKVFIVHGHKEQIKKEISRYVKSLGFTPIVLKEQINGGLSLLDKFEKVAEEVSFAIVLYTCCDKGGKAGSKRYNPRARQNVVFEHGFFEAKLGSARVFIICENGVELPSDINGKMYIPVNDEWKKELKKELINATFLPKRLKLEDAFVTQEELDEILKS